MKNIDELKMALHELRASMGQASNCDDINRLNIAVEQWKAALNEIILGLEKEA